MGFQRFKICKLTHLIAILTLPVAAMTWTSTVQASEEFSHATALIGTPKYPKNFPHFDYVNPDAPKIGAVRLADPGGTFDSLNPVPPKGVIAEGLGLMYETLLTSSLDEISTMYGLIAEGISYPEDYSSVTFKLRKEARWNDGTPITVDDVIYSLDAWKTNNPSRDYYYRNVVDAQETGENQVTFNFDVKGNTELPHIVGQLLILPKHYWEGRDSDGEKRDISRITLDPNIVTSGPYKIKEVQPNRRISYELDDNYWGKELNVRIGKHNFKEVSYDVYRDSTVALLAFLADEFDYRVENRAQAWAQEYETAAVKDGRIVKELFDERGSGTTSGFFFNLRKEKFQDPRVRQALALAFNFEEMNKTLFFGQYQRSSSYYHETELSATGLPEGRELEILQALKSEVPQAMFNTAFQPSFHKDRRETRTNLRAAKKLLKEAGYEVRDGKLVNGATGAPFEVEFMSASPSSERYLLRVKEAFQPLGVTTKIRSVDSSQYVERARARNYDMILLQFGQSLSPGNEQREYWGSEAADRDASSNYAGIKNPAVDELIEQIILAKNREDLVQTTKALDRVLLWNHYIIPAWDLKQVRSARWDRFSAPKTLPLYAEPGFPTIWWYDEDKAAAVAAKSR